MKIKFLACWGVCRKILRVKFGEFLDYLESRPQGVTFQVVVSPTVAQLRWGTEKRDYVDAENRVSAVSAQETLSHDEGLLNNPLMKVQPNISGVNEASNRSPEHTDTVFCGKDFGRRLLIKDSTNVDEMYILVQGPRRSAPPVDNDAENAHEDEDIFAKDCKILDAQSFVNFATFHNAIIGRTIRLPVHDKTECNGWHGPGAWTEDDDRLDEEDLKIFSSLSRPTSCRKEWQSRTV